MNFVLTSFDRYSSRFLGSKDLPVQIASLLQLFVEGFADGLLLFWPCLLFCGTLGDEDLELRQPSVKVAKVLINAHVAHDVVHELLTVGR